MKFSSLLVILIIVVSLFGCKSSKELAYFQDLKDTTKIQSVVQYPYEPLKIKVDDQLQIAISSTGAEAAQYLIW